MIHTHTSLFTARTTFRLGQSWSHPTSGLRTPLSGGQHWQHSHHRSARAGGYGRPYTACARRARQGPMHRLRPAYANECLALFQSRCRHLSANSVCRARRIRGLHCLANASRGGSPPCSLSCRRLMGRILRPSVRAQLPSSRHSTARVQPLLRTLICASHSAAQSRQLALGPTTLTPARITSAWSVTRSANPPP